MSPRYLADKSALARMPNAVVRRRLAPLIEAGDVATCAMVELEVLFSARNHEDHSRVRERRALASPRVPLRDDHFARAIERQGELARSGRHRVPTPDLVIAAVGEGAGLVVLHHDADFDVIASVTGQPVEWVAPRDTVP